MTASPDCGHSRCSQNYIDTGSTSCLDVEDKLDARKAARRAAIAWKRAAKARREGGPNLTPYLAFHFHSARCARLLGYTIPPDNEVEDMVRSLLRLSDMKRGIVDRIQRPRSEDGRSYVFWQGWHSGREQSLWGPMMRRGARETSWSDLVMVQRAILGKTPSVSGTRWGEALGTISSSSTVTNA